MAQQSTTTHDTLANTEYFQNTDPPNVLKTLGTENGRKPVLTRIGIEQNLKGPAYDLSINCFVNTLELRYGEYFVMTK